MHNGAHLEEDERRCLADSQAQRDLFILVLLIVLSCIVSATGVVIFVIIIVKGESYNYSFQ